MLLELTVSDLGVIDELSLVLGPGMTAITGETGAGKTVVVGAIELLAGARSDPSMVRPGANEAVVEGRFLTGDPLTGDPLAGAEPGGEPGGELVITRAIPRTGRSRAYVDGRPATAGALAERVASLVDLHGQHTHVALLSTATQRRALDRYGGVDLAPLRLARSRLAEAVTALAALGGDRVSRDHEIDLLRYQVAELDEAGLLDDEEDDRLSALEELLADAAGHRVAAASAAETLGTDGGVGDLVAVAAAALADRQPFAEQSSRLQALVVELADLARDLRARAEEIEADPERLAAVQARRAQLSQLRRRYGPTAGGRSCSLAELIAGRDDLRARLEALEGADVRADAAEAERRAATVVVRAAAAAVGASRRRAAVPLAAAVEERLHELALGRARFGVEVGAEDPGDDVTFLLAANPGLAAAPLARAASGGELARTMLAVRLVLTESAPTLVFDEVDAGVGGAAARAVGRALAQLAVDRQVLVVTHLPQVAAFADAQVALTKEETRTATGLGTVVRAEVLAGTARVRELSRMISGLPGSGTAREHAEELLVSAARERRK